MQRLGITHSEARILDAVAGFERRRKGAGEELLELVARGLGESPAVTAALAALDPLEVEGVIPLLARQVLVDLEELVLPNVKKRRGLAAFLARHLAYETLEVGPTLFLRWTIENARRCLSGYVDYQALARKELPDRIRNFDTETNNSRLVKKFYDEEIAIAGLPPVRVAEDLTPDHVLLFGALLTVQGYNLVPGLPAPSLIRGVCRRLWEKASNPAARKLAPKAAVRQKQQFATRGYGFPLAPFVNRARKAARPRIEARRQREAEERRVAREAYETAKAERRERAREREREAAEAARREAEERLASQREALARKSVRDRERWEAARRSREAAAAAIDARNRELLGEARKAARSRKAERAREREERARAEEAARRAALEAHLAALPEDLRGAGAAELVEVLKRDPHAAEPAAEEKELVARWDRTLRDPEWTLRVDPDLRGLVETWLSNELAYDEWLEHLERRSAAAREREAEARIQAGRRERELRRETEEREAELERVRLPGTRWSEHLAYLESLTTGERIERLKVSGLVGPPGGFATLERHLLGATTAREARDFGSERWQDIGSAFAELTTLERLAFYGVTVRFARELPGVPNPDFLVIDTLDARASEARIRPLDVKKIYLDRPEEGRSPAENAAHYFGAKLAKAGRQLAEGLRRYGNPNPARLHGGRSDGRGGTALFLLQTRAPGETRAERLRTACARFREVLVELDAAGRIDAVDCVLVVLDYVDGMRLQRPVLGLHRIEHGAGGDSPENIAQACPGWVNGHEYVDYLTSQYNVRRAQGEEAARFNTSGATIELAGLG